MLIPTISTVAVRCSACGQLEFHTLSLFHFSGLPSKKISCSCGKTLLRIRTKNRKKFSVQVECVICETKHVFHLSRKKLWSNEVYTFYCEENGFEIGYVGPKKKVKACIENENKTIAEMAEKLGYTDYFDNPEVMYDILDRLYKLAEQGNLKCNCGNNDIAMEIFPDYLELKCEHCHAHAVIMASSEEDLEIVNKLDEIRLTKFTSISKNLAKRKTRNSKKSK